MSGALAASTIMAVPCGVVFSRPARASISPTSECVRLSISISDTRAVKQGQSVGHHLQSGGDAAAIFAVDLQVRVARELDAAGAQRPAHPAWTSPDRSVTAVM